jgi:hypothetical protein
VLELILFCAGVYCLLHGQWILTLLLFTASHLVGKEK